jgi:hypothetical protein
VVWGIATRITHLLAQFCYSITKKVWQVSGL